MKFLSFKPIREEHLIGVVGRFQQSGGSSPGHAADPVRGDSENDLSRRYADKLGSGIVDGLADDGSSAVNMEILEKLRQSIDGDIEPTLKKFLEGLPKRLEAIADAMGRGSPSKTAQAGHKLRGSTSTLGALRLSALCRELEAAGNANQTPDDGKLLASILKEGGRVQAEIETLLKGRVS